MQIFDLAKAVELLEGSRSQRLGIEASAGTGKTWTLERLVLTLVLKRGLPLGRVLVLTYTEAATMELKERIRLRLQEIVDAGTAGRELAATIALNLDDPLVRERAKLALGQFDQSAVHTIHGFCKRVITRYGLEMGLGQQTMDLADTDQRLDAVAADLLFAMLYGRDAELQDLWGAECLASVGSGRSGREKDPMEVLRDKLRSWVDQGYADSRLYASTLDQCLAAREVLADKAWTAELLASARQIADSGFALLDAMGLADYAYGQTIDHEHYGMTKVSASSLIRDSVSFWQDLRQALAHESRLPFDAVLQALPKREELYKWYGDWSGKRPKGRIKDLDVLRSTGPGVPAALERHNAALARLLDCIYSMESKVLPLAGYPDPLDLVDFWQAQPEADLPKDLDENWRIREIAALAFFARFAARYRTMVDALRRQDGLLDFAGMIDLVHALARQDDPVLRRSVGQSFEALLVDEFQDTDALQWDIFTRIFAGDAAQPATLILVGDPKQAIYGFRGADVAVYHKAMGSLREQERFELETNHRSSINLVDGGSFLWPLIPESTGFPKHGAIKASASIQKKLVESCASEGIPYNPDEPAWHMVPLAGSKREASWRAWIGAEIRSLVASGESAGNIAILTATNALANQMQAWLQRAGLPCRQSGGGSLGSSPATDTLLALATALASPGHRGALRACALSLAGFRRLGPKGPPALDEDAMPLAIRLHKARQIYEERGFLSAFVAILDPLLPQLVQRNDGRRLLTDLYQIAEIFDERCRKERVRGERLGEACRECLRRLRGEEAQSLHLDRSDPAITIMTMHSSKGLEFPVVFLFPAMPDKNPSRRFPASYQHAGQRHIVFSKRTDLEPELQAAETLDTLTRMYVALTRATRRQYLPLPEPKAPAKGKSKTKAKEAPAPGPADWLVRLVQAVSNDPGLQPCRPFDPQQDSAVFQRCFQLRSVTPAEDRPGAVPAATQDSAMRRDPGEPVGGLTAVPVAGRFPSLSSYSTIARHIAGGHESAANPPAPRPEPGALPAGKDFGNLVHRILELNDFRVLCDPAATAPGSPVWSESSRLARFYGFGQRQYERFAPELFGLIRATLQLPVDFGGETCPCVDLDPLSLRKEVPFTLSLPKAHKGIRNPDILSALQLPRGYEVKPGFLNGVIDLVVWRNGHLWVIDWKTNQLPAFDPASLDQAMTEACYRLQAALYLAVLQQQFPGMPPGGSRYIFARHPACHVFDPPADLIPALLADLGVSS